MGLAVPVVTAQWFYTPSLGCPLVYATPQATAFLKGVVEIKPILGDLQVAKSVESDFLLNASSVANSDLLVILTAIPAHDLGVTGKALLSPGLLMAVVNNSMLTRVCVCGSLFEVLAVRSVFSLYCWPNQLGPITAAVTAIA